MKKIYTLIAAALLATGAAAQNPTAYFMEGSTFRSQFNPAFAPLRGYVNIPAIGGVNINVGGNIAVDNILFSRDGKLVTLLDSSVSAADALSGLKQNNLLGMDFRMNVIGFGAFTKNHKNFWSFDLGSTKTPTCPTRSSNSSNSARRARSATSAPRRTPTSRRLSATRSR
jgi:hypothetical protein